MNHTTIIESIWNFPLPALRELEGSIAKLRQFKEEIFVSKAEDFPGSNGVSPSSPEKEALPAPSTGRAVPAPRQPLRPPKAGSLRHTVHEILRGANRPIQRRDIINTAARLRGASVDINFKAKVGDILTNAIDPNISRVGYGKYQYRETSA